VISEISFFLVSIWRSSQARMKTWGNLAVLVRLVFAVHRKGMAIQLWYCDCVLFQMRLDSWPEAAQAPFSGVGELHGLSGLSGRTTLFLVRSEYS
jgi:hypothetical protein